jgi:hypothetical protein
MRTALEQSLRERGARQQQGSRMSLLTANPYGGTQGSSARRLYGLGRADTESAINAGLAEIARQDYAERIAAMERANAQEQRRYELDQARQAAEDANYQREQDQRAGFWRGLGGILTGGLGGG